MSTALLDLQQPHADDDPAAPDGHDLLAVRAWARSRGYPIDEAAGVPTVVLRTYQRVHAA